MNLADAIADVRELTKRVDKDNLIIRKVNAACAFINGTAKFPQDRYEVVYGVADIEANEYVQTLALPERTRIIEYVQDATNGIALKGASPPEIMRSVVDKDMYYRSGNNVICKFGIYPTQVNIGVFLSLERLVEEEDSNWLLEEEHGAYDVVVDLAAAWVLNSIGEKEMAKGIIDWAGQSLSVYVADRMAERY